MNTNEKYLNLFTDFGFKKIFGTEFNKELLIDFLNQVLGDRENIEDLTYLNTENLGITEWDRKAISDLHCQNEKGETFIIELQNVTQQFFKDRSIFYSTFPIQRQAVKGKDWDYSLKAVYTIGLLNFSFPDVAVSDRYLREIQLLDKHTHEIFYDKLTYIYLEMPKFKKAESQLETQFDKWIYVLKNLHKLQAKPRKLQEKVFEKLFSEAEIAKLKPEDMNAYEESLKTYRDNYSVLKTAREEGRREGRQEGWEEGLEQGKIEVAKKMKIKGTEISVISDLTGLSSEQIERL